MKTNYDAIVIGSGFGGVMAALKLVRAGWKVLMLERGNWVQRSPDNWGPKGSVDLSPFYDKSTPVHVAAGGNKKVMGLYSCVGGPSVFYGGVSFRFRQADFEKNEEIEGDNAMGWPITYKQLEPYYGQAENILQVSGETGVDLTEPYRSSNFVQGKATLAGISKKVKESAQRLGLHPFQLPLAINYEDRNRAACIHCANCDTYACAISAKNDLATLVIPELLKQGLEILPNMVVSRLEVKHGYIEEVIAVSKLTGETKIFSGSKIILAAGALSTPHLLLASGLDKYNSAGRVIGRYLMRHVNAIIFGIFPGVADKEGRFHKQLAILDYYFGHPEFNKGFGKLGSLQQMPTPPMSLVQNEVPGILGKFLSQGVRLLSGLLAIAEDQPQFGNSISIDKNHRDIYGLPRAVVFHQYSARDLAALKTLIGEAKKIMTGAGAISHYVHQIRTFSHAVGTVRMGLNPELTALDENCQFRGLNNLYITDGSVMPTAAALNPSLTIAANALRVGEQISKLNA